MPVRLPIGAAITDLKGKKKINEARRLQASVYSNFNARRNAGRIERYFIQLKNRRLTTSAYVTAVIVVIVLIILCVSGVRSSYLNSLDIKTHKILNTMYLNISHQISAAIGESYYNSNFFSEFYRQPTPKIDINNISSGVKFTNSFVSINAYSSGKSTYYWMKTNEGYLYGIFAPNASRKCKLIFGHDGEYYSWDADENGFNSSYPYEGGSKILAPYDNDENVYNITTSKNESIWTDLFIMRNTADLPLMIASASPSSNVLSGKISYVTFVSILLDSLQSILTSIAEACTTHFALLTQDGTLISITGEESPVDYYQGYIIPKPINQVSDPLWSSVVHDSSFKSGNNFTIKYKDRNFAVVNFDVQAAPSVLWKVYAISDITNSYGKADNLDISVYALIIVACGVAFLVTLLGLIVISQIIQQNRTKYVASSQDINSKHVRHMGYQAGAIELRKAKSVAENETTYSELIDIIFEMERGSYASFDQALLLSHVQRQDVLFKLQSIFGRPDKVYTNSRVGPSLTFDEPRPRADPLDNSNAKERILEIVEPYFGNDTLNIEKLVDIVLEEKVPEKYHGLIIGSLDFLDFLFHQKFVGIFTQLNMGPALMVSLLCWHAGMGERVPELINKFFIVDQKAFNQLVRNIIGRCKIPNDNMIEEWTDLISIIFQLTSVAAIDKQQIVISTCTTKRLNLETGITQRESLDYGKMLFITSTLHFFFDDAETSHKIQTMLRSGAENESQSTDFLNCLITEELNPLINCLAIICGHRFVKDLANR